MAYRNLRFGPYRATEGVSTPLNPLEDVLGWLSYLSSRDYVTHKLIKTHGLSSSDANARSKLILPHIKCAREFISQGLDGPEEVSFLPLYYAILDLIKVLILVSPRHADLSSHRWHGASYAVTGKDSQSPLTDCITLKRGGALALLYEIMIGKPWPIEKEVKMRDIYPYITDVSHELHLATGQRSQIASLQFDDPFVTKKKVRIRICAYPYDRTHILTKKDLSGSRNIRATAESNIFESKKLYSIGTQWEDIFDDIWDRRYIYHSHDLKTVIPTNCGRFGFTEELPIALAFFHMSSVVRYKPDFLMKISETRFWPVISTMRKQCLYKFLVIFWGHFHKSTIRINGA